VSDKSERILVRVRLVENEVIPVHGKLNREVAGHADILATILARKSVRMSVSVSVSVYVSAPWNVSFTQQQRVNYIHNQTRPARCSIFNPNNQSNNFVLSSLRYREATQFVVAATNHRALSSDESMTTTEMR